MAGVRGMRNPMPAKIPLAKGIFKQRVAPAKLPDSDVKAAAMKSDRLGPPSGRNSGTAPGKSHYVNDGLKRGTAK